MNFYISSTTEPNFEIFPKADTNDFFKKLYFSFLLETFKNLKVLPLGPHKPKHELKPLLFSQLSI